MYWKLKIGSQVLDEADRLLTPTFTPELSYLFNVLPKERQTCLFTATLTSSIESIAEAPPRPGKQKPFIHRMTDTYARMHINPCLRFPALTCLI